MRVNEEETFFRRALDGVRRVAANYPDFTADDVWRELGLFAAPTEPRAIGPVMLRAQQLGYCQPTDRTRATRNPRAHRRPMRVWVSLLARGAR